MKATIALLVLFALVLAGGYWWSQRPAGTPPMAVQTATTTPPAATTTPAAADQEAASYTLAQVQTHTTSKSCWAAINGNVYDLTTWISRHPGGAARILSICGKDGTPYFMGQHGSDPTAQAQLATFKIGTLAQ
jgi:cytochrome b involved in lipid metabolism